MNSFRRRSFRIAAGLFYLSFADMFLTRSKAAQPPGGLLASMPTQLHRHQRFIESAVVMRRLAVSRGDQAYGAVIVKSGQIVGEAPSRVVINGDPTAHAEMEAIRNAAYRTGSRDLSNCVMYSTSRPCPMCEAAAFWARIDRMFYGVDAEDGGAPRLGRC